MKRIAIATDSNSGLSQKEAKELGVFVFPMPIFIDEKLYTEGFTIDQEEFFRRQAAGAQISTSQPAPGDLTAFWDRILKDYETLIYLPMSSALSSSCATAAGLSQGYGGRVVVVDNVRISVTLRMAVLEAKEMAEKGASVEEICDHLLSTKLETIVYITVNTLEYLKRGGRITPAVASIGTLLNIKPVLVIDGGKLDVFCQCRGLRSAKKRIIQALKNDLVHRFHADMSSMNLHAAGCFSREDAFAWKGELEQTFGVSCSLERLPLSVATHTGFGVWGAGLTRKFHYER